MSAGSEALEAYGYKFLRDRYIQPGRSTQAWQPVGSGGFLRFDFVQAIPMPFKVRDDAEKQHGLNHNDPADQVYYEWVWPDEEVARIYGHAVEQKAAGWPDLRPEDERGG